MTFTRHRREVLAALLYHLNILIFYPSPPRGSDGFQQIIHIINISDMKQNELSEAEEWKYILRQIGFGAALGAAFLTVVYLGGLLAHLVSGM
jgi:hypothetical protein